MIMISQFDKIRRVRVAGCPVDTLSYAETLSWVRDVIESRRVRRQAFINAGKVVLANKDPAILNLLQGCDLLSADGMSVVWASRLLGSDIPERVNGTNMMFSVLEMSNTEGYRVYLLGATANVVDDLAQVIRQRFPDVQLAGRHHGYFAADEEAEIAEMIRTSGPDLVLVGMGTPKQELWIERNAHRIGAPLAIGVGGSFDVLAGHIHRAPEWAQRAGLEWAWRLMQEPRRLWRRYLIGNPRFVWLVAKDWMARRQGVG